MKKLFLSMILVAGLMMLPMGAGATTFTFDQSQLIQLWQVYENPSATGSFYDDQSWDAGEASGYIASGSDESVEYIGGLADDGGPSPFAQMQIGSNFWGTSSNTGESGPSVGTLGVGDLTGYDKFALKFENTNDDTWWVNLYLNTGWTDSPWGETDNYYENGWTELKVGQSATLTVDLTGVSNLNHVSNIGFNVGGNMGTGLGDDPSNPDTFKITVSPVPEPSTMLLLGAGFIGMAAIGRKKFFKK
jgi:hypothetical protein